MGRATIALFAVLAACGPSTPATASPPPPTTAPEPTPCDPTLANLDRVLGPEFAAGAKLDLGDDMQVTREWVIMRCAHLSAWNRACLTLSTTRDELRGCNPGSEPWARHHPTEEERAVFDECAAAATSRAELDKCGY
jgi:hypothetical protein